MPTHRLKDKVKNRQPYWVVFWRPFFPTYVGYMFAYLDRAEWLSGNPGSLYSDVGDWIRLNAQRKTGRND